MISGAAYVQPVAGHTDVSGYLIVRDGDNRWFLWRGNDEEGLTEISESTATWMRKRAEIEDFPAPRLWFEVETLPLTGQLDPTPLH
jgi:hypothetical protein